MTRAEAAALVKEWVKTESLRRHLLTVECVMEAAARQAGLPESGPDSVEAWRCVGLLHDLDYERHPTRDKHPFKCVELLKTKGVPASWTDAILGHATYSGVPRETPMAKTLFAVDELAGFIVACAKVRPSGIADLEPKSVKKKLKVASFAAAVSRAEIDQGIAELAVDPTEHIQTCIDAIRDAGLA